MIVIDLKELCPSPRPSPQRGEGEKTAPSSSLTSKGRGGKDRTEQFPFSKGAKGKRPHRAVPFPQRGEGEKTAPSIPLSLKRRGGKDRREQFPLPYGERVRVRGKDRPRQLPLPKEARRKRPQGTVPSPLWGEG